MAAGYIRDGVVNFVGGIAQAVAVFKSDCKVLGLCLRAQTRSSSCLAAGYYRDGVVNFVGGIAQAVNFNNLKVLIWFLSRSFQLKRCADTVCLDRYERAALISWLVLRSLEVLRDAGGALTISVIRGVGQLSVPWTGRFVPEFLWECVAVPVAYWMCVSSEQLVTTFPIYNNLKVPI